MKKEQEHIKVYTAKDIQQYHEGSMSSADMYAMEKAALDDPFLADAIEGFSIGKADQQNKDLQSIRIDLEKRIKKNEKKSLLVPIWMRAAIIVLALSLGGLTIYQLFNSNTETHTEAIAKNEKVSPLKSDTITANEQPKADTEAIVQIETQLLKKEDDIASASKPASPAKKEPATTTLTAPAGNDEPALSAETIKDREPVRDVAKSVTANRATERKDDLRSIQPEQGLNAFSGKVLDNNNKPVAGATISARNKQASVVTDLNGNFKLNAPDSTLDIDVSSLGYQQNNVTLKSNSGVPNKIILQEATGDMEEVVVVGYGSRAKKELRKQKRDSARLKVMEDREAVEPVDGWDEYDTYISTHIRKPPGNLEISGEVILSFEVNEKHELSKIKIEKSLSQDLDQEAIRLVKEGPQWKTKKGKRAKGKLAIKF